MHFNTITASVIAAALLMAGPASAWNWRTKTCLWNGSQIPCKVDHTANGMGWAVQFNNGAQNVYYLPDQTVRLTSPEGRVSSERVQVKNVFCDVLGTSVLRAVDQDGGVLVIVR